MKKLIPIIFVILMFHLSGAININFLNKIGLTKIDFSKLKEERIVLIDALIIEPEDVGGTENYEHLRNTLNIHYNAFTKIKNYFDKN